MSRLRQIFESIVYAGMKPAGTPQDKRLRWLGPLAEPLTRFLDGGARPDDPFYLTNRTIGQRLRLAIVIAVPCMLVAGGIGLAAIGYFEPSADLLSPQAAPTTEEVAVKMLPDLNKNLNIASNHDVEVSDVHVDHSAGTRVAGTARNNTDHVVENTELVFNLTDRSGSRLGAVSTRIARLAPKSTAPFSFAVEQQNAAFALVREVVQP